MESLKGAENQIFEQNEEIEMNTLHHTKTPKRRRAFSRNTAGSGKQLSHWPSWRLLATVLACLLVLGVAAGRANSSATDDKKIVADLDTQYQAAVEKNDAGMMDRILADDFVLVTGSGKTYSKADLLAEARSGRMEYEHQSDTLQTVRVWGGTAIVTAKLWEKGIDSGKPFDYTLWFSDTYVRTPTGWRYVFGQASLPLPKNF